MSDTLKELDNLISEIAELDGQAEGMKLTLKALNEQIAEKERKVMAMLEQAELKTFKGSRGSMTIASRWGVKMPKEPEVKEALKAYCEERGIWDNLWTINHQTLNSMFKQAMEAATEAGEMIDIPGLNPVEDKYLQFRGAK